MAEHDEEPLDLVEDEGLEGLIPLEVTGSDEDGVTPVAPL